MALKQKTLSVHEKLKLSQTWGTKNQLCHKLKFQ